MMTNELLRSAAVAAVVFWALLGLWIIFGHVVYNRRRTAVRAAVRALTESASTGTPAEKAERVRGLISSVPRTVLHELASDLSIPQPVAEVFAFVLLERFGLPHFVQIATQSRGEFSKWRRIAALRILSLVHGAQMLVLLESAIEDPDPDVVFHAITILGAMQDAEAARLLIRALHAGQGAPSRAATELDVFPLDINGLLEPLAASTNANARFWGAVLLARYPTHENQKRVLSLIEDQDPKVRKAAIQSLARMRSSATAGASRTLLADPAPFVRAHAARSLAEMRAVATAADIAALLTDREWWVRLAARESLVALGREAWPAVEPYLHHADRFARNGAAEVMQNLGILDDAIREAGDDDAKAEQLISTIREAAGEGMLEALVGRLGAIRTSAIIRLRETLGLADEAEQL